MLALAFGLAYVGMTGCCLGMPKHYRQVWNAEPAAHVSLLWRVVGWVLLIVALAVSVLDGGAAIGSVTWLGMLSATGIALTVILPAHPRTAIWAGPASLALAIVWMLLR